VALDRRSSVVDARAHGDAVVIGGRQQPDEPALVADPR
jgi:hypothetical protein